MTAFAVAAFRAAISHIMDFDVGGRASEPPFSLPRINPDERTEMPDDDDDGDERDDERVTMKCFLNIQRGPLGQRSAQLCGMLTI